MTQETNKFPPMPDDFWPELTIERHGGNPVIHGRYKHGSLGFAVLGDRKCDVTFHEALNGLRNALWQYGEWYQDKFEAV